MSEATSRSPLSKPFWFVSLLIVPGLFLATANPAAAGVRAGGTQPAWHILNRWTQQQGLPQNNVNAILQTRDGYLWIGTKGGVARFDGVHFTIYDDRDQTQLRENEISSLVEGADSSLWIGTRGGGVSHLKDGKFTVYTTREGLVNDFVVALCRDRSGGIWIGTDSGLSRFQDGRFTSYSVVNGLSDNAIASLFADEEGNVWIGTNEGILNRFRGGKFTAFTLKDVERGNRIRTICSDREGYLWLAYRGGLHRFKDGNTTHYGVADGLASDQVSSLALDASGILWIGSPGGLNWCQNGKIFTFDDLARKSVVSVHGDREGSVWVGAQGLNCLRRGLFESYTVSEGLSYHYVTSVLEDREGTVWIGTGRGLNRLKNGEFTALTTAHGLPEALVGGLAEDREGNLWIGTDQGVFRSERATGKFVPVTDPSLPNLRPRSIYVDRQGAVWISANLDGLARYQDGKFTRFTTAHGLSHNVVRGICEDAEGNLWLGTRAGLSCFKDGKFTVYKDRDGLADNIVEMVYLDRDNALWVATHHGVSRFKDGRFVTYTSRDGLYSSFVYNFAEDDSGNLWMSCSKGIFRVAKKELVDFAEGKINSITSFVYGREHGLCTTTATGGFGRSSYRTRDGRLWFSMTDGLNVLNPANVSSNSEVLPVHVEQLVIDGRDAQVSDPASAITEAPPGRGDVVFRYTAINFLAPEKVRFKYQLIGHDPGWVDAEDRRIASYNNLSPGKYTFQVTAANSEGLWNGTVAMVPFYLKPNWYQTWSFRAATAAALLLLAMGAYELRVRQLQHRQRLLEYRVAERTAQLEAANKELEAFSYSVSHDLRAPLRSIDGFSKAVLDEHSGGLDPEGRANLERVRQASQRMEGLIDDMLTLSSLSRTEMNRTMVDLSAMARSIARDLHTTDPRRQVLFVIAPDLKIKADPSLMRIALENLLNNAWKYTSKHSDARIELGVNRQNGQDVYFVRDDGAGFDMAFASKLFGAFQRLHPAAQFNGTGIGLATVQRVIHRHGGRAWAEAAIEKGATFYFTLSD